MQVAIDLEKARPGIGERQKDEYSRGESLAPGMTVAARSSPFWQVCSKRNMIAEATWGVRTCSGSARQSM